jgi:predicted transcriptional regulator
MLAAADVCKQRQAMPTREQRQAMPTREQVAKAVRAYAQRNRLPAEQVPTVVHAVLAALERVTFPKITAHRSELAKTIGLSQRGNTTRIIERVVAPSNVIERAVARLASETKLRGILTQS